MQWRRSARAWAFTAPLLLAAGAACAAAGSDAAWRAHTAAMQGRKADTLAAVQQLPQASADHGWSRTPQYAALVRFGLWDELIALQLPLPADSGETAGYLYGRGVALAARGRLAEAQHSLAALRALALQAQDSTLSALLHIAEPIVAARIAASDGGSAQAVQLLQQAVAAEDQLPAAHSDSWFFPARHLLGAQLLIAHRPREAAAVYREDLARNPGNGWALYGLTQALRAQGKEAAALRVSREFAEAWRGADVRLTASAFWFAGADTTSCECQRQGLTRAAGGS